MLRFLATVVCAVFVLALAAHAMTVQPMVVDLVAGSRQSASVLAVENTFSTPITVEMRTVEADATEEGLAASNRESNDLLIFPPQALIRPGQTQAFRVQYVGDGVPATSKHYYVTVAQLPVELPDTESAIQVVYNFNVAISVGLPRVAPAIRIVSSDVWRAPEGSEYHPRIRFENTSTNYGYVSEGRLRVRYTPSAGGEAIERTYTPQELRDAIGFGLVAAQQTRMIALPMVVPGPGGSIEAEFTPAPSP